MNPELPTLLHRWREGTLTPEEMRTLTALLAQPEARAALRRDWFLETALPQALAASSVVVRTPQPSLIARWRCAFASWLTRFAPQATREEESGLGALRIWARASFAALAVGLIATTWLAWPQPQSTRADFGSEPAAIAQLMLETQLPDAP